MNSVLIERQTQAPVPQERGLGRGVYEVLRWAPHVRAGFTEEITFTLDLEMGVFRQEGHEGNTD